MDAALDYHNHLTPAAIEARDRYLASKLRDGLRSMGDTKLYVSEDPRFPVGARILHVREGVGRVQGR